MRRERDDISEPVVITSLIGMAVIIAIATAAKMLGY